MPEVMPVKLDRIPKVANGPSILPTKEMQLSGIDLVAATYVFSNNLPPSKILIDVGPFHIDRKATFTLVPKEKLVDDVFDVVIKILYHTSPSYLWFLPITIMVLFLCHTFCSSQQAALEMRSLSMGTLATIKENHMPSKVDEVHRIYVPMWTAGHWYLMIIDNVRHKLIYLDSLALYFESITLDQAWLSSNDGVSPRFSTYDIEDADIPQQARGSMDCGVWIVNVATWMRLAIDLVLKEHNENAKALVAKAMSH
ncbi:Ulp1 protease family, carboxy-terminal domain protein [Arachis hypogaea]|nr:Ulp1 protease family, carboxy-terminal domain protein [Arachis hypogaea]